jgi:hypothetical protein
MNNHHYVHFFCKNCGQAIQLDASLLSFKTVPTISNLEVPDQITDYRGHLSQRLVVADKLFRIVSKETSIDQPMCDDCAQEMTVVLESQLAELVKEATSYKQFLEQHQNVQDDSHQVLELEMVHQYSCSWRNKNKKHCKY